MLYFKFNTDNFVAPQKEYAVTKYEDGKPIFPPQKEICAVDLHQIQNFFFQKLYNELHLSEVGINHALYDVIGIPVDTFSINDEVIGNFDGAIRFVLSEYAKLPIDKLDGKSLNDLGINIEFCKRCLNEETNSKIKIFMQENNLKYVTEDVLWKNMTDDERANKFSQYLIKIGSMDNELIIADPYIFSSRQDYYCKMLASILELSKAKTIIVITDKKNYRDRCFDKISNKTAISIEVKYSNDFHDRFWIANRKNGFYTGTSFNGVGKKISLIHMLSDDDVVCIIDELCKQSLIS